MGGSLGGGIGLALGNMLASGRIFLPFFFSVAGSHGAAIAISSVFFSSDFSSLFSSIFVFFGIRANELTGGNQPGSRSGANVMLVLGRLSPLFPTSLVPSVSSNIHPSIKLLLSFMTCF